MSDMTQLAQILVVGAGYAFLAFSIGWWVGYSSAQREATRETRVEEPDTEAVTYTYRNVDENTLPRPNAGTRRTG